MRLSLAQVQVEYNYLKCKVTYAIHNFICILGQNTTYKGRCNPSSFTHFHYLMYII